MSMRDAFRRAGMEVPEEPARREAAAGQGNRGGQRSRGGRPGDGRQERNLPAFPDAYFIPDEGKPDEGKPCLHTSFVSKRTVDPFSEKMANANPRLTTGQIRRFFNHCREIERRLKVDGESWPQVAADFESLSAHAQYASSGQNRKIPHEFRQFIDDNVKRVTSWDEPRTAFLKGFIPHFEALVGFGTAHMRDS